MPSQPSTVHKAQCCGQIMYALGNRYPIAVEQDLDAGIPHPVQLLGKHLVIWNSGVDNTWR